MEWCSDSGDDYLSDDAELFLSIDNSHQFPNGTGKSFNVLNLHEIERRQNEEITHISSVFNVTQSAAIALLHHYRWNVTQLHDRWFSDEKSVRETVGIMENNSSNNNLHGDGVVVSCGICFDNFNIDQVYVVGCDHAYCGTCWKGYISVSINETGLGCLSLRCPDPKCPAIVGRDLVLKLGSSDEIEKYLKYLLRSYVECKKDMAKWCPSPGCENAIEIEIDDGSSKNGFDVVCNCGFPFCWNCVEDCHRPVDCDTVKKWMAKNSSEAENTNWILAYSKPCPKCKRPIEKNHGCNHMTCYAPCRYEFCWLCLGDYKKHGMCNSYNSKKDGANWKDEDERKRVLAKISLERYTHYYERWASNEKSRNKAIQDLQKTKSQHLKPLGDKVKVPEIQLNFILEAWDQIVECRRVLKWTYAYGYYIPEKEDAKLQLFECLQGEAESALERLHHCVERELIEKFLGNNYNEPMHDFEEFRPKLVGLTKITRSFFENLVRAMENGLSEAQAHSSSSSKAKRNRNSKKRIKGSSLRYDDNSTGYWNCDRCTYLNEDTNVTCQMCFEDGV